MAQVSVTINGRRYQIACDDGQEAHLARLGAFIDKRVEQLAAAVGRVEDARLLVMASLLVADELWDAYAQLETRGGASGAAANEDALGQRMEALAERIERLADHLERA